MDLHLYVPFNMFRLSIYYVQLWNVSLHCVRTYQTNAMSLWHLAKLSSLDNSGKRSVLRYLYILTLRRHHYRNIKWCCWIVTMSFHCYKTHINFWITLKTNHRNGVSLAHPGLHLFCYTLISAPYWIIRVPSWYQTLWSSQRAAQWRPQPSLISRMALRTL